MLTRPFAPIQYNDDEKLYFGAKPYDKAGDSCLTEIALINDDSPEDEDDGEAFQLATPEALAAEEASELAAEAEEAEM